MSLVLDVTHREGGFEVTSKVDEISVSAQNVNAASLALAVILCNVEGECSRVFGKLTDCRTIWISYTTSQLHAKGWMNQTGQGRMTYRHRLLLLLYRSKSFLRPLSTP